MDRIKNTAEGFDHRNEERSYKQVLVKFMSLNEPTEFDAIAYTADISESGIGLITTHSLPVGTDIAIFFEESAIGVGEVVNLDEEWWLCDWCGTERMGVRLRKKSPGWPV
jgi:hypothetical protein